MSRRASNGDRKRPPDGGTRARGVNGHPDKDCARCGRPFSWRKKWERDWENVRYCSDKCRMGKSA